MDLVNNIIIDVDVSKITTDNYNSLLHHTVDYMLWPEYWVGNQHFPEGELKICFTTLKEHGITVEKFIEDIKNYWKDTPFLQKYGELSFNVTKSYLLITRKKIDWDSIEKQCTWENVNEE